MRYCCDLSGDCSAVSVVGGRSYEVLYLWRERLWLAEALLADGKEVYNCDLVRDERMNDFRGGIPSG